MMQGSWCVLGLVFLALCSLAQADDAIVESFDEVALRAPEGKGSESLVEGHAGQANELKYEKDGQNAFFTSRLRGQPSWDDAAGLSFWVRGDGSHEVGVLHFIYDDDFSVRYEFAFPLDDKQWHKVVVPWSDLIPVLPGERSVWLDARRGNKPSKISAVWIGKWWHWRDYPACSFAIDDLKLEPKIEAAEVSGSSGVERVRAKLARGEPITIVTMGDSLTDRRHWANREVAWPDLLVADLAKSSKSKVTIVNPAIGGTQLRQGLIHMPRWVVDTPEPDLVTVFFGGNDYESGMREEAFRDSCQRAVERIRRMTGEKADVLLLTTAPSLERWDQTAELAKACRDAAAESKTGLADVRAAFVREGASDAQRLFVNDRVHLSAAGHRVVAETVVHALTDKK
jgi:lysophospholipase L1-like esterase